MLPAGRVFPISGAGSNFEDSVAQPDEALRTLCVFSVRALKTAAHLLDKPITAHFHLRIKTVQSIRVGQSCDFNHGVL
jgi:hypothetical protein